MTKIKLIVMSGLPCVGKSEISEAIAKQLSIPLFSVDPIESAIIKSGLKRSFETGLAAYLVAETLAEEHLKKHGQSVVIDAVNSEQEAKDTWLNLSKKLNVELKIIHCILNENTHKQRVESRNRNMHGIAEVEWANVEKRRKTSVDWTVEVCTLNTEEPTSENVKKAVEYIGI